MKRGSGNVEWKIRVHLADYHLHQSPTINHHHHYQYSDVFANAAISRSLRSLLSRSLSPRTAIESELATSSRALIPFLVILRLWLKSTSKYM